MQTYILYVLYILRNLLRVTSVIFKKRKLYILLAFEQISIIAQLSGTSSRKLQYGAIGKTHEGDLQSLHNDKKGSYSSLIEKNRQSTFEMRQQKCLC